MTKQLIAADTSQPPKDRMTSANENLHRSYK